MHNTQQQIILSINSANCSDNSLHSAITRPHLKYCIQLGVPQYSRGFIRFLYSNADRDQRLGGHSTWYRRSWRSRVCSDPSEGGRRTRWGRATDMAFVLSLWWFYAAGQLSSNTTATALSVPLLGAAGHGLTSHSPCCCWPAVFVSFLKSTLTEAQTTSLTGSALASGRSLWSWLKLDLI